MRDPDLDGILSDDHAQWHRSVTKKEFIYVGFLINHLSITFELLSIDEIPEPIGLDIDIETFFSLPIPSRVWTGKRVFHSRAFVEFVAGQHS